MEKQKHIPVRPQKIKTKGYFEVEIDTQNIKEGLLVKKERENLKVLNPYYYQHYDRIEQKDIKSL